MINLFKFQELNKWGYDEKNQIIQLNKDNLDSFINKFQRVFIKFCSTNCKYCSFSRREYSLLGQRMKELEDGIPIAEINIKNDHDIINKYELQGLPSFQLFINQENIEYKGIRNVDEFHRWIDQNKSFDLNEITRKQDIENLKEEEMAVLFLLPNNHQNLLKNYIVLQLKNPNIPFTHSFSDDLKEDFKVTKPFTFIVFRKFQKDYKILQLDQVENMKQFKIFFKKVKFPIISTFNQVTAERIFGEQQNALIYLSDTEDGGYELFHQFANTYQNHDLILIHSSINHKLGIKLSEYLNVEFDQQGVFRLVSFKEYKLKKYKIKARNLNELIQSIKNYQNDKLKPYYKSQPLPDQVNKKNIQIVVSDNYDDIVCNSDKYVILLTFASWCDFSLQLQPIFEKLANIFEKNSNIIFAKIDGTLNEHPALIRKKFPTIQLYKPGKLDSIKFKGQRTLENLQKFISEEIDLQFNEFKDNEL